MKKKLKFILPILSLIFLILDICFIWILHIIPIKYILLVFSILLFIVTLITYLVINKKMWIKIIGYIISFIFILFSVIGIYYFNKTNNFLNKSFNNSIEYYTNSYYLIGLNSFENKNIKNKKIGYYSNIPHIDEVIKEISKSYLITKFEYENVDDMLIGLSNNQIDMFVIEKTLYNYIKENSDVLDNKYIIIDDFDVSIYEKQEEVSQYKDSFNIYIGGLDFTEQYTDFNMIVTVNMKTHEILLTSTPRDYYVEIDGKNGKDLLGYAGVWGVNTSKKTLENLYGINIDYYVRLNTRSLVTLVDTLGTVEFCSDYSFTTTHATVMGTYDDRLGNKLRVKSGCHEYTGIEILTIARERLAYVDGDRQRQKNCQAIMISIFEKLIRPENLTNYTNILDALSELYTTNIPRKLVTNFIKDTVDNPKRWNISTQSVNGYSSVNYVHFSNYLDNVMIPYMDTVGDATNKINDVLNKK